MDYAAVIMNKIAKEAKVPICLHFDHGTDFKKIESAINYGFTSVMYDGSSLPYEVNIKNTKIVSEMAHKKGVSVEAELGRVGGAEGGGEDNIEAEYTKVSEVNDFIDRTDVDALAVAIGTAHGQYKIKPVLDIGRLAEIYSISKRPLVLHGGSGLSDDDFKNTIKNGIRKVNICTEMCVALRNAYLNSANHEILFDDGKNAVKEVVKGKMKLFGSTDKA
jgi:fructose-bisphosphate aldolase class II